MADMSKEVKELVEQWFDELTPQCDAFKQQFSAQGEGFLKYLLALFMMESALAAELGIPVEYLHDFMRKIITLWFHAGRPQDFSVAKVHVELKPKGKPN